MKFGKNSTVLIATFSTYKGKKRTYTGNLQAMLSFFVPRFKKVVLIDQPHPTSSDVVPLIEVYERGKLVKKYPLSSLFYQPLYWLCRKRNVFDQTIISFKIRDFLSVLHLGLTLKEKFSLFVGLESINALAGVLLKKLGQVKTVACYVSDFSPKRYPQKWFNDLYLRFDRLTATYSDFIWDVSPAMHPGRIKAGLDPQKSAPCLRVPNALFPEQIRPLPLKKIKPYTIVYMGTLDIDNGSDVAIEALPLVLKKTPQARLHIIGGGDPAFPRRLKKLASKLKMRKYVKFHDFISDPEKLSKTLSQFYLAVAPYRDIPESFRFYGDSTKIRAYFSVGLPVITTHVPPIGKEIVKAKSGLVVKDNGRALARAIIKFFANKKLYRQYRQAAIAFAQQNTWENSYGQALKKMEKINA